MVSFDAVVDAYAIGRPDYPPAVFEALEPLPGRVVIEGGCGTGIATRELTSRGARVIAFDIGAAMVTHTARHSPGAWGAVVADGGQLPCGDAVADVLCFAQSWHWMNPATRVTEAARVLVPNGRWAGWWSHPRADSESWFDAYWSLIEAACPGTHRSQRNTDWGADLRASGLFTVRDRVTVPWIRSVVVEHWLTDERSKSYVSELPTQRREELLADVHTVVSTAFPGGVMTVPYETWLWTADVRQ